MVPARVLGSFKALLGLVTAIFTLTLSFAAEADAERTSAGLLVIDSAVASTASAAARIESTSGSRMNLPDDWSHSRPDYSGTVWYQVNLALDDAALTGEPVTLYVQRACSDLAVRVNGSEVYSSGQTSLPPDRNCSRPHLVWLPAAMLRRGDNRLDLGVTGRSLGSVASRHRAAGLSRVEVGPKALLEARHADSLAWAPTWALASQAAVLTLGCLMLAVGWLNPREVYFLFFGWLCLGWATLSFASEWWPVAWPHAATELLVPSAWAALFAAAAQFLLSYAGVRSRAIERWIAAQCLIVPATLMFAPPGWFFSAVRAWYTVLAVELFAVCVIHFLVMLRQRRTELLPTSLAIIAGGALLGSEIAVQWGAVPARLSPASALLPLLFLLVGWRLFLTFARALRATEAGRSQLALRLQQLTSEFDQRVEEVTLRRVEEFTELERKRIASDLHDDLGAKLLTIVHTSDSARIPDLAREALEEMRLSVRGLAGKPVLLADALGDWRAEVVARLRQANIAAVWEAPSEGISYVLPSRVFMQLTRILREAVSNVIKHSVASHCEIRWAVTAGILFLTVRDDGQGISADLNRGQGMLSMKRRAKKLNGQCLVGSRPGAGVLISLTVPLEASSAAVKSAAVT